MPSVCSTCSHCMFLKNLNRFIILKSNLNSKRVKNFLLAIADKIRFWYRYTYICVQKHSITQRKLHDCVCKYLCLSSSIDWRSHWAASDLLHLCCLCVAISDVCKQCKHKNTNMVALMHVSSISVWFCIVLASLKSTHWHKPNYLYNRIGLNSPYFIPIYQLGRDLSEWVTDIIYWKKNKPLISVGSFRNVANEGNNQCLCYTA